MNRVNPVKETVKPGGLSKAARQMSMDATTNHPNEPDADDRIVIAIDRLTAQAEEVACHLGDISGFLERLVDAAEDQEAR